MPSHWHRRPRFLSRQPQDLPELCAWIILSLIVAGRVGGCTSRSWPALSRPSGLPHRRDRPQRPVGIRSRRFSMPPSLRRSSRSASPSHLSLRAVALVYAWVLGNRVGAAEKGTAGMQFIAQAVRDGSNAYLRRQFTTVGVLLLFLTFGIILTKWPWDPSDANAADTESHCLSRGVAFLLGSIFSATVGFFGMRLATTGQPPRGRGGAARVSPGHAARLSDRHRHRHADDRPWLAWRLR